MKDDKKICMYCNKNNKQCSKFATHTAESIFGRVFYCKKHINIRRNSIVIRNSEKLYLTNSHQLSGG